MCDSMEMLGNLASPHCMFPMVFIPNYLARPWKGSHIKSNIYDENYM